VTTSYRYPFAPFPDGWYLVRTSAEVAAGAVEPLRYFGRELVAYRTVSDQVVVAGAHCPHMGAHLGFGGAVEGDGIRCPFHGWRFDGAGRCDHVPYSTSGRAPNVHLDTLPVCETSGLILVWFSAAGNAPTWQPTSRPEFGQPGWIGYESVSWTIRAHVQEVAENVPDMPHFGTVHGVPGDLRAEVETDGHIYRQRSIAVIDGNPWEFTRQEAQGLGLIWLVSGGDEPYWFLTATTPVDDEHIELRLLYLVQQDGTELSAANRARLDATSENVARDVPIWEHKAYVERAPLIPDDGPIRTIRQWAKQFYPAVQGSRAR
jgi:phenylpropionate dioxygenase-like ring-hydroxylating dioxygenase large terminal subunit